MNPTAQATRKVGFANSGKGRMGSAALRSTMMKPASASSASATSPRMSGESQANV